MKREKRKQVRKACSNCAKSHAACSEDRPCSRCTKRGLSCSDVTRKKRRSYSPTPLDTPVDAEAQDQDTGQEVQEAVPYGMPVSFTAYPLGKGYYPYPTAKSFVPPHPSFYRHKQRQELIGPQFSLHGFGNSEDLMSLKVLNSFNKEDLYLTLPSTRPPISVPDIQAAIPIPVSPTSCTKSTQGGPPDPNGIPLYASFPFQSILPIPVLSSESNFTVNNNNILSIEKPPCVVPPGEVNYNNNNNNNILSIEKPSCVVPQPEGTPSEPLVDITKKAFVPFQSNIMNPLDSKHWPPTPLESKVEEV